MYSSLALSRTGGDGRVRDRSRGHARTLLDLGFAPTSAAAPTLVVSSLTVGMRLGERVSERLQREVVHALLAIIGSQLIFGGARVA